MKQLLIILLFCPLLCFSQKALEKELDSVSTKEEAKTFAKTHKKTNKGKLVTFNREKHRTRLADELFKLSKGGKKVVKSEDKKTYCKVIDKENVVHQRVSYIFFDGRQMSESEINAKRTKIVSQFKQGYTFEALAKLHSMNSGAKRGGDLGWFPEGKMHLDFEEAIKSHDTNDIFTLDITDQKWHYVVLKTHDAKPIKEITVLKYTEVTK